MTLHFSRATAKAVGTPERKSSANKWGSGRGLPSLANQSLRERCLVFQVCDYLSQADLIRQMNKGLRIAGD